MQSMQCNQSNSKLSADLCELVQDFGLVSFLPLAIEDRAALQAVLNQVCALFAVCDVL